MTRGLIGCLRWYHAHIVPVAPPSISVIVPASVTVAANSSAVLDLHASGEPPPSVRWSKGGEVLVTGSRVLVTETLSLVITNLQLSDAGIYVARVYNPIGFQEVVFSVSVYGEFLCCFIAVICANCRFVQRNRSARHLSTV